MLVKEICSSSLETEIAFRKGIRRVARLVKPGASEDLQSPLKLKPDASYIKQLLN